MTVVQFNNFSCGYGHLIVVRGLSLVVSSGESVGLVGRNGVGKTTALLAAAGIRFSSVSGSITIDDVDVTRLKPHEILKTGLGLVPEGRRIFRQMSVEENVELGLWLEPPLKRPELAERWDYVFELFPQLSDMRRTSAGQLSGGQQQMVALAQALIGRPEVLLLDEPCAGLSPGVSNQLYGALGRLREDGKGILVVEQDLERALANTERCYAMEAGRIELEVQSKASDAFASVAAVVSARAPLDDKSGADVATL